MSPSYLGLDIADLVTTRSLQRSFHYITLPPPDPAYFTAVLLYVDDFALLASYRAELLALMQLTLVRKQLPPLSRSLASDSRGVPVRARGGGV